MTDWSQTSAVQKRPPFRRSPHRRIAGVASGIGRYVSIDPNIIRVVFVLLSLAGGSGFLLYMGAWLLMAPPEDIGTDVHVVPDHSGPGRVLGGALVGVAVVLGLTTFTGFEPVEYFVLAALFAGIVILNRRPDNVDPTPRPPDPVAWPAPAGAPIEPSETTPFDPPPFNPEPTEGMVVNPRPVDPTEVLDEADKPDATEVMETANNNLGANLGENLVEDPAEAPPPPDTSDLNLDTDATTETTPDWPPPGSSPTTSETPGVGLDPGPRPELGMQFPSSEVPGLQDDLAPEFESVGAAPRSARPHWAVTKTAEETSLQSGDPYDPGPPLAAVTMAAILAVVGVALVLNTVAGLAVGAVTVVGISLVIVGTALAVTAFTGRSLPLVPIAVLMTGALLASPTIDHAIEDGTGSRSFVVRSAADLQPFYQLGAGEFTFDMSQLELTEDTAVRVELGTGSMELFLPEGLITEVHAETTVGYTGVFGRERAGIEPSLHVLPAPSSEGEGPRLLLDLSTTIGSIDVYRVRS